MKRQYILCCTLFMLFYFNSFATIRNVPNQYLTIQSAINASISGDTVLVQPGFYHENITIDSKNIVIGSLFLTTNDTSYIASTVIDGDSFLATIVTYSGSIDTTSLLTGFTITGGDSFGNGGGISCIDASPTISYNIIRDNYCKDLGGGIYLNNSDAIIFKNTISGNSLTSDMSNQGGGIYSRDSDVKIIENNISNNSTNYDGYGGGIACYSTNSHPYIFNNTITNNSAFYGGGISCAGENVVIDGNNISRNYAINHGGGINCVKSQIINNIISHNRAQTEGGGIKAFEGTPYIYNNIIYSDSSLRGGGISLIASNAELSHNVIHHNYSSKGGGLWGVSSFPSIENNTFSHNKSPDCSAIWLDTPTDTIRNNIFSFNVESPAIYTIGTILSHNDIYGNAAGNFQNSPFPGTAVISTVNINGDSCDVYKNIYLDPLFVDASNNDFQLTPDSPCIDAGDPTSPNDPNNSIADIGAFYYDYVLPVELILFTANIMEGKVQLNWSTATELNNYGFNIERKVTNSDWKNIGFVEGAGNSTTVIDYSFIDNESISSSVQYRLQQVDLDGSFEYSNVVEANLGLPTEFELSQNYPNPFNPATTINFTLPEDAIVKISVYNAIGEKVIDVINNQMEAGYHKVNFDGKNLTSGLYFYRIETSTFSSTKKMVLLK